MKQFSLFFIILLVLSGCGMKEEVAKQQEGNQPKEKEQKAEAKPKADDDLKEISNERFIAKIKEVYYKNPKVFLAPPVKEEEAKREEEQTTEPEKNRDNKIHHAAATTQKEPKTTQITHESKTETNEQDKPDPEPKPEPKPEPEPDLIDVPLISQMPELDRGCEVTSLAMLLASADIHVSKMKLAKQIPKVPFEKNGLRGNPNNGFVGNIYTFDKPGLGVFHGPVADLAREYLGDRVVDLTGSQWSRIEKQLDKGRPVWVIVTSTYRYVPDRFWDTWKTKDGKIRITYKEHAVLLTGYDEDTIYFNDPLAGIKNRSENKEAFIDGWIQYGRQAISYN